MSTTEKSESGPWKIGDVTARTVIERQNEIPAGDFIPAAKSEALARTSFGCGRGPWGTRITCGS